MRPVVEFTCVDCEISMNTTYAVLEDGSYICDTCSHILEVDTLKSLHNQEKPYTVYCGPDSKLVTDWLGRKLGRIMSLGDKPHPSTVNSHFGQKYHAHIRDVNGNWWRGWVCPGLYANIRPWKLKEKTL